MRSRKKSVDMEGRGGGEELEAHNQNILYQRKSIFNVYERKRKKIGGGRERFQTAYLSTVEQTFP